MFPIPILPVDPVMGSSSAYYHVYMINKTSGQLSLSKSPPPPPPPPNLKKLVENFNKNLSQISYKLSDQIHFSKTS
ncbi:hypothetical protein BY996DRAFT_6499311 [Phakopsora pachyrhizi]|nr:hypothetical protein BY996DRAFT_6499311 [Phakopsora pachyrhizi]